MIVADSALICYLLIPGEFTGAAERVRSLDAEWVAPPVWISEFRQVIRNYLKRSEISLKLATEYTELAEELMRDRVISSPSELILDLVSSTGCSAFHGEYAALARSNHLPLVTPDRKLLRAFPRLAIHPKDFTGPA